MPSRSIVFLLLVFAFSAVSTKGSQESETERALVLDGGNLFDGSGGPVRTDPGIVVIGETIVCVGSAENCAAPDGAQSVELDDGAWILPGLVDAHVHLGRLAGSTGDRARWIFPTYSPMSRTWRVRSHSPSVTSELTCARA